MKRTCANVIFINNMIDYIRNDEKKEAYNSIITVHIGLFLHSTIGLNYRAKIATDVSFAKTKFYNLHSIKEKKKMECKCRQNSLKFSYSL